MQPFWILVILVTIILTSFFQDPVFIWSTCVGFLVIAFFSTRRNIDPSSNTVMDKMMGPVALRRIKKLREKYDEIQHKYMALKIASDEQSLQNVILDGELTRMQDMMRFMMESFHELSKGQADAFIAKVKKGSMDNRGVRPYINECLGIKAARRSKRNGKEGPQRGARIIDLG